MCQQHDKCDTSHKVSSLNVYPTYILHSDADGCIPGAVVQGARIVPAFVGEMRGQCKHKRTSVVHIYEFIHHQSEQKKEERKERKKKNDDASVIGIQNAKSIRHDTHRIRRDCSRATTVTHTCAYMRKRVIPASHS
jgi:hypothetical protein